MKCLGIIIPKEKWWDTGLLVLLIANGRLDDVKKLLCHGVPCNGRSWSPLHEAALQGDADIAETLIASGADVSCRDFDDDLPLEFAIDGLSNSHGRCAQVLIANGARIGEIRSSDMRLKAEYNGLIEFEQGVLKCRSSCVAFLNLRAHLHVGGKYMVREMAFAIWSTRFDEKWTL